MFLDPIKVSSFWGEIFESNASNCQEITFLFFRDIKPQNSFIISCFLKIHIGQIGFFSGEATTHKWEWNVSSSECPVFMDFFCILLFKKKIYCNIIFPIWSIAIPQKWRRNSKHLLSALDFPVVLEAPGSVKNTALKKKKKGKIVQILNIFTPFVLARFTGKAAAGVSLRTVCIGGIQLEPRVGLTFFFPCTESLTACHTVHNPNECPLPPLCRSCPAAAGLY